MEIYLVRCTENDPEVLYWSMGAYSTQRFAMDALMNHAKQVADDPEDAHELTLILDDWEILTVVVDTTGAITKTTA